MKTKSSIVVVIFVMLATVVLTCLTGCDARYKPVSFAIDDGYTVIFDANEATFFIKDSSSTVVGELRPNGAWNVDSEGNQTYLGMSDNETSLDIDLRLYPQYDPQGITVLVNGNTAEHVGTSAYTKTRIVGEDMIEEYYTSVKFSYTLEAGRNYGVEISGIKALTIGGNKWKLHGVKVGEDVYISGTIYQNHKVGQDLDLRLDFQQGGTASVMYKDSTSSATENGTWTEQDNVLNATFSKEIGNFELTVLTAQQRKQYIIDTENASGMSEEAKAFGIGLLGNIGSIEVILVLDID